MVGTVVTSSFLIEWLDISIAIGLDWIEMNINDSHIVKMIIGMSHNP